MPLKNIIESSSHHLQLKAESVAPATSYVTNGLVFSWGAMTFNQVMMLIGTVLALATFAVNLYFQKRRDRREQELHRKRMETSGKPEQSRDSG